MKIKKIELKKLKSILGSSSSIALRSKISARMKSSSVINDKFISSFPIWASGSAVVIGLEWAVEFVCGPTEEIELYHI